MPLKAHPHSGNDFVCRYAIKSDGAITPPIFSIKDPTALQEYIVNEIQEVYRSRVKINDKHIEVIVRQMMRKMTITDPGDTRFLEGQLVDKTDFLKRTTGSLTKRLSLKPATVPTCVRVRSLPFVRFVKRTAC